MLVLAVVAAAHGAFELPPAGVMVTVASGLLILGRPDSPLWDLLAPEKDNGRPSEAMRAADRCLCRARGWDLSCDIGPRAARSIGGTGSLARRRDAGGGVGLSLSLVLERDERSALPRGTARLLRPSRFIAPVGSWRVEAVDETTLLPTALEIKLSCNGLGQGGEVMVKEGLLYLRAAVEQDASAGRVAALSGGESGGDASLRLVEGSVAVQEDLGMGFAEFKLVGSFEARPALQQAGRVKEAEVGVAGATGNSER